jgi:ABC-type branched-subunit amino acid transport system ATPase component/branched-subunit amino acid ABC-type transport system permease component
VSDFLTFVVAGITVGSVFALVASGLVLTYRTSGVLNFAHGALAIVSVDAYIYFTINLGLPWQAGAALAVVGVGAIAGLLLEPLARCLVRVTPARQVVATIGLLVAIESASTLLGPHLPGSHPHFVLPPLPGGTVSISGVNVGEDQIIIMGVSLVVGLALWAFLARTRSGLAMRAVVSNPELLDLSGTNPVAVRRRGWMIGAMFAGLSGVLLALAPTYGLSSGTVNLVVLPSFAAAAMATFTSLPVAYASGLFVGIVSALLTKYDTLSWLLGLSATSPYVILFVATIALSLGRRGRAAGRPPRPPRRRRAQGPGWIPLVPAAAVAVGMVLAPTWAGFGIGSYTTTLIFAILFLSLGLLLKTGGMACLCQFSFAAVGATSFARLTTHLHLPWFLALLFAVLAAGVAGAVVAVPVIRLSGSYLGLATVAFGFVLADLVYPTNLMFGSSVSALQASRPQFAGSDNAYYYLVAFFLVLSALAVWVVTRSRLGRLVGGLADSPLALQAQGASTNVTRLLVFVVSAAIAGLAGALLGGLNDYVTSSYFNPEASLTLVAVLFVVRLTDPWDALVAAGVYYFLPEKVSLSQAATWVSFAFGALAVYAVVADGRGRTRPTLTDLMARLVRPEPSPAVAAPPAGAATSAAQARPAASEQPTPGRSGLEVVDLTVRFGGLTALDNVTVRADAGAITGLIGPNGAGKTTLLNVCSGLLHPSSGRVLLGGEDLSGLSAPERARMGLGRTFQHIELFESLTVREAVGLSREAALAGASPYRHLIGRNQTASARAAEVDEAIDLCGLGAISGQVVGDLSAGHRRLAELGRCLAWPFAMLLLDEPTAGLDRAESERLGGILERVVDARRVGVLIVEHNVSLVMAICSEVAVLDFGRLLFEGEPSEVMASELVRGAYLGGPVGNASL